MIADDVDHGRRGAFRVVDIGKAVRETGTQVQERRCRFVRHARIAIGRAGDDTLEHAEHAAHARLAIKRRDEMHLRCAGIGETHIDAASQQRVAQGIGAIHERVFPDGELVRMGPCHHRRTGTSGLNPLLAFGS